jgi:predicted RecB family nuclease
MYKRDNELLYSPSDLNAFLENEAVTWLDRLNLECPGELKADEPAEEDALIRRTGDEHEQSFLTGLEGGGSDVAMIGRNDRAAFAKTIHAMRQGREVIYQARLQHGEFAGWADFLFRVDGRSTLGAWHYEVWDTKLSRSLKPYFVIQLCCYAEMLNSIQGRMSDEVGIILGNGDRKPLPVLDYWFYYRAIKRAFLDQQRGFNRNHPPAFSGLADYRHWTGHVSRMLEARDDVAQVANIRRSQIEKLATAGITTMAGLAASGLETLPGMATSTFQRLRSQARLQCASVPGTPPPYEVSAPDADAKRQGFAMLPPPSRNDVCFDIEGYPLIDGGLEYLLGATTCEGGGLRFQDWWAPVRLRSAPPKFSFRFADFPQCCCSPPVAEVVGLFAGNRARNRETN